MKTNRFKSKQKRILVIEGSSIYHKKQIYDPVSGQVVEAENNIPQPLNQQEPIESPSPIQGKKVGFLKAKLSNFVAQKILDKKNKKVRDVKNIIEIE